MTEIYLHIVASMADYMDTHPYLQGRHGAAVWAVARLASQAIPRGTAGGGGEAGAETVPS